MVVYLKINLWGKKQIGLFVILVFGKVERVYFICVVTITSHTAHMIYLQCAWSFLVKCLGIKMFGLELCCWNNYFWPERSDSETVICTLGENIRKYPIEARERFLDIWKPFLSSSIYLKTGVFCTSQLSGQYSIEKAFLATGSMAQ